MHAATERPRSRHVVSWQPFESATEETSTSGVAGNVAEVQPEWGYALFSKN